MKRHKNVTSNSSKDAHSDDARWAAVLARDTSVDGRFFYSVATTGVYCRPSCPSRRPNRFNIRFHDTQRAAETAGFRACKRCKPDQPPRDARNAVKVAEACRWIESLETAPKLHDLARRARVSPYHFHRIFKSIVGVTPNAYAVAHRQRRVRENLARSETVTDAIHASGFNSSGRFYANASAVLGMKPADFRAGGKNSEIKFAIGACSLGAILVASTGIGVCAILIGDDPSALLRDLEDRFPNAQLIGGDRVFERSMAKVIGYVDSPGDRFDLPLDVRGTAFQHKVWRALQDIPAGATASYTDIAARIGKPKAVRAVAQACAANPVAIAIPCHRVVRNDGALSGYRWGIARKQALLETEARKRKGRK